MIRLLKIILVAVVIAAGSIYYFEVTNLNVPQEIETKNDEPLEEIAKESLEEKIEEEVPIKAPVKKTPAEKTPTKETVQTTKTAPVVESPVKQEVVTSVPMRGPSATNDSNLTAEGSVMETNIQRQINGLPSLTTNQKLTLAAQKKVDDMFARQYFEHVSPTGEGPSYLADFVGYDYLMVGENLALGNYEGNSVLLQAWMDSPGHRANILNPKYTEIGIAVKFGIYEGFPTWLAVQEFGRPASDCPSPNPSLGAEIETSKILSSQLKDQVVLIYNEIENMSPKSGTLYMEKVEVYNILVQEYNSFIEKLRVLIESYNAQVLIYNSCI